jgi:hypothetical protein
MNRLYYLLPLVLITVGCAAPTAPTPTPGPTQPFDPVGHWKLLHTDGTIFYITLNPDGTGLSFWEKAEGTPGTWRFDGERLVCTWKDKWTDIIFKEGDSFVKIAYKDRKPEGPPDNRNKAEKVDKIPPKPDVK